MRTCNGRLWCRFGASGNGLDTDRTETFERPLSLDCIDVDLLSLTPGAGCCGVWPGATARIKKRNIAPSPLFTVSVKVQLEVAGAPTWLTNYLDSPSHKIYKTCSKFSLRPADYYTYYTIGDIQTSPDPSRQRRGVRSA
jgi:hypothetical protein